VLVHGAFTSSHLWQDLLPRLPKGHRVLVLDLLGHGRSDPPRGAAMTVTAHADRLARLLDVMGVPVASLVGHGMGAAISALVARQHPSRVAHLALVNPTMLGRDPRDVLVSRRVRRLTRLAPLWRRLSPGWLASALHSALLPAYAQRTTGVHALDLYLKPFRTREGRDAAIAQLQALDASREDVAAAIAPGVLACPVVVALGESDPLVPSRRTGRVVAALAEAARAGCEMHRLPGVAHVAPEEAPDRLGTLIASLLTR
jgi:pimeloyl-ACP methyl ester carboxylesterase